MAFELKYENGKYKTKEAIYEEAVEEIEILLCNLEDETALEIGNEYRDQNGESLLYVNDEDNVNEELESQDPYALLCMGRHDWSDYDAFFSFDGYDIESTDDVWAGIDTDDVARAILDGDLRDVPSEIREVIDDYDEACEALDNLNKERIAGEELLARFTNCEADVTDLLQYIDRLVRNDDVWKED